MGAIPVVKGKVVRATKINSCGKPIGGAKNRIVTDGAIRVNLSPEMKAAEDIEQTNMEGKVCISDRTPPERKWYNAEIQFCGVDPELFTLLTGYPLELDHNDNVIGYQDQKAVEADFGAMIEVWTGGRSDDDCPTPTTDGSMFADTTSGKSYGYLKFGGTEWTPGDFTVEAGASTFTMTGRTIETPHWGRGPYNVMRIDDAGTAGRLLTADNDDTQLRFFRTRVEPPEPTDGARALDLAGKFVAPNYYYGGPGNAAAADVAPEQDADADGVELTITGGPTGGAFSLGISYAGGGDEETGTIAFNATAANVKTALVAPDDGYAAADWTVTGGTLPGGTVTIVPPEGVTVTVADNNLTGGTTPTVHLDPA